MKIFFKAMLAGGILLGAAVAGHGASLQFDGVDDFLKPPAASIVLSNRSFTIECWARRDATNRDEYVMCSGNGADFNSNRYLFIGFRPNDCVVFGFYGNTLTLTTPPIVDGAWHHYACTYDVATRARIIYLDGNVIGEDTAAAQFQGGSDLLIGAQHTGPYFKGWLDEFRIWGTVRTQVEIQQYMRQSLQGNEISLMAYYPMAEGTGATTADASGHGLTAALNNGVLWNIQDPLPPAALTGPATLVTNASARLSGWVNPNGALTTNYFEWGAGCALQFDGLDDAVTFSTNFNAFPLTVTAWIKTAPGARGGIVNKYGAGSFNGWNLRVLGGRIRAWYFRNSGSYIWGAAAEPEGLDGGGVDDGQWHHVAFTVSTNSSAGGKLYVDGALRASRSWTGTPGVSTTSELLRFGDYGGDHFAGQLDEVTIWQAELSPDAIAQLMNSPPGPAHSQYASLWAYWPLDGDLVDARNRNAPGVPVGNPRSAFDHTTAPQLVTGSNSVVKLDGVAGHVVVPPGYWFTNGDFTIECKVFLRRYSNFGRILDFGNYAGGDEVILCLGGGIGGGLLLYSYTPGRSVVGSPTPVPTNQWVHLAATLRGSQASLYLNGVLWASGYLNIPNNVQQNQNYLGRPLWPDETYGDMLMDEMRLWNVARTPDQIRQFMNQSVATNEPNLLLNYKFDEPSGATVLDSRTVSPQNGILTNGAFRLSSIPVTAALTNLAPGTIYYFRNVAESANGTSFGAPERFSTMAPGGGTALEFDGSDDYLRVADIGARLPSAEVTLEFWVNLHQKTLEPDLVYPVPDQLTNRFLVHFGRLDDRIFWDFGDINAGGRLYYDLPEDINGTWQHFAFVASSNGNYMKIFRNGVEVKSAAQFNNFLPGDYDLILGFNFKGELDEFRIWNQARSGAEIQRDLHTRLSGQESGLVAYYHMDEGAGDMLVDASTNASHGLLVNGPVWTPAGAPIGLLIATTMQATMAAGNQVMLNGVAKPIGSGNFAWFEWGASTNYGQATAITNMDGDAAEVTVRTEVAGLTLGVTYHYRLAASNSLGFVYGEDRTFLLPAVSSLADSGPGSLRQAMADALPGAILLLTNSGMIVLTSGELLLTKNVTITGPGATNLAISGNFASRVFNLASGITASISGLTLCNGRSADGANGSGVGAAGQPGQSGGGIRNAGTLTLSDCVITNNSTGNGGGGGAGNSNTGGVGGAGGNGGDGGSGSGIYNHTSGVLSLLRCSIRGNLSGVGGSGGTGGMGKNHYGSAGAGSNGGPGGIGGTGGLGAGIFSAGVMTMDDCLIAENRCGQGGAGGTGGTGGHSDLWHSGRSGGSGGSGGQGGAGGGIFGNTMSSLRNSTISGNYSGTGGSGGPGGVRGTSDGSFGSGSNGSPGAGGHGGGGGGLYNTGSLALHSFTTAFNGTGLGGGGGPWPYLGISGAPGMGGGVCSAGTAQPVQIVNSIVALNVSPIGFDDDVYGAFASLGHNLIGATVNSSGFDASSDRLNQPPLLAPLADNGGPAWTHALWPESPAINAGTNAYLSSSFDQRGVPRMVCTNVDIGAFEYVGCPPGSDPQSQKALHFDGTDAYVQAGAVNLANTSFTIEAWARRLSTNTMDFIVGQGSASDNCGLHFGFHYASGFATNLFVFGFFNNDLPTTIAYTDNNWHHWAGTYNINTRARCLYRDGILVASNTAAAHYQGTGTLIIGRLPWLSGSAFHGLLDEVRIWNVARTPTEVRNNYRRVLFGAEPGLLLYYRFNEGSGTTATNSAASGSAFNGALQLGPFYVPSGSGLLQSLGLPQILLDGHLLETNSVEITNTVEITLRTDYTNGTIHYSLGGGDPFGGSQYVGPFGLVTSAVLRVVAFNVDYTDWQEAPAITVEFIPHFSLQLEGAQGGLLQPAPPGGSYLRDTTVTLSAVPSNGWIFGGWERDAAGTNNPLMVTMTRPKTVRAIFSTTLTNTVLPANGGIIARSPDSTWYPYGSTVQLSAVPNAGYYFASWAGAASGQTNNPLAFVITNTTPMVSALFASLQTNYYALNIIVQGQGEVQQSPRSAFYSNNVLVTLTAVPAPGWAFARWSEATNATNNPLSVLMDGNKTLTAMFRNLATNAPPSVVLLVPTNAAKYYLPATIVIQADASDADGAVDSVTYLAWQSGSTSGPVQLGVLTDSPYTLTWSNASAGTYDLFAVAVDNAGLAVTSALVSITASPPEFRLSQELHLVNEFENQVVVRVLKRGGGATINYATGDGTAKAVNNDGFGDYQALSGSLTFGPLDAEKTIAIPIINDLAAEGNQAFYLQLSLTGDGSVLGNPAQATIRIIDDEPPPGVGSALTVIIPSQWPGSGQVRMHLEPATPEVQWRFRWETEWRTNDTVATGLEPGDYTVDFKAVSGSIAPPPDTFVLGAGATVARTNYYIVSAQPATGSLVVVLQPLGGRWRFQGQANWFTNATAAANIPTGEHVLEFEPVSGRVTPAPARVVVTNGIVATVSVYYPPQVDWGASTPAEPATVNIASLQAQQNPYACMGQLWTDAGYSSGYVVKPRVVLTAGHALFNEASLSFVNEALWFFQRHKDEQEPLPQKARGWYVFSGYSAARSNSPTGQSSLDAYQLDVAAAYFPQSAGRGGYGGYVVSDATKNWLTGPENKLLAGYPVSGKDGLVPGKLCATMPTPFSLDLEQGGVYSSRNFRSYPGNSGGPLCVLNTNGYYYPAAIYLGESGPKSIGRIIDTNVVDLLNRADLSANTGDNNTGGGVVLLTPGAGGGLFTPGYLQVVVGPQAALDTGAGWRLVGHPLPDYFSNNTALYGLLAGGYTVEFKGIPGFQTPSNRAVQIVSGQTAVISGDYLVFGPGIVAPLRRTNGVFAFGLTGQSGKVYVMEASTNLGQTNWTIIATNTMGSNGVWQFADPASTNLNSRYYRAKEWE